MPAPAVAQTARRVHQQRARSHDVHLQQLHRRLRCRSGMPPRSGRARPPRGSRCQRHRARAKASPDDLLVALEIQRIELSVQHPRAARPRASSSAAACERRRVASHERHLARRVALQLAHDRKRDLRAPAEHDHPPPRRPRRRARSPRCPRTRPSRRARSERSTPSGSTRSRTLAKRSSCGYIARNSLRRRRASFVRYTRPPQPATSPSSSSSAVASPGAAAGISSASVQPSSGKDNGTAEGRPEALEHRQIDGERVDVGSARRRLRARAPGLRGSRAGTESAHAAHRGDSIHRAHRAGRSMEPAPADVHARVVVPRASAAR